MTNGACDCFSLNVLSSTLSSLQLTGDFLAPYLLSSIDHGKGMMMAINETPIDILTWGNHEADIPHKEVCKHVRNFSGTFINSNMPTHDAMDAMVPYHIVEIASADGTQSRKIGLVATLSNDPKLYSQFKAPGAFGGATIEDPWETLAYYNKLLKEDHGCDLVIPLEHM
jgi:2',3'-cyclic-nucleotide 2'-phosphodiesterase (5'-nucleotidase family)